MAIDKNQDWKEWANCINIKRWAYIDDLLPKGGNYNKSQFKVK